MLHARKDYDRIQDPEGLIPEDEPVFLLRAKDILAPGILIHWASELVIRGGDKEMASIVVKHAKKMIDWQEEHGCKLPDLPRVEIDPNCDHQQAIKDYVANKSWCPKCGYYI